MKIALRIISTICFGMGVTLLVPTESEAAAVAGACKYEPNPNDNAFRQCINMQTYCQSCDKTIETRCTGCYSSNGCKYDYHENLKTCRPRWDSSIPGEVTNPDHCPRFKKQREPAYDRCKHLVPTYASTVSFLIANDFDITSEKILRALFDAENSVDVRADQVLKGGSIKESGGGAVK